MVADSRRENIVTDIVTALQGINGAPNYHNTLETFQVTQMARVPSEGLSFPFITVTLDTDNRDMLHNEADANSFNIIIRIYVQNNENTKTKDLNRAIRDVEVALNIDRTRNNNAYDTQILSITNSEEFETGEFAIAELTVNCPYLILRNNP